jgi:hypothetical protein
MSKYDQQDINEAKALINQSLDEIEKDDLVSAQHSLKEAISCLSGAKRTYLLDKLLKQDQEQNQPAK